MCKDCGCTIAGGHHHSHEHTHGDGHTHSHEHDHHGSHGHDGEHEHHHHHHEHLHQNPQLNDKKTIAVITKILDENDREAASNRAHFNEAKVLAVNLMSSPGSGKTTLLEKTIEEGSLKIAVIEGDLETNKDADRIKAKGAAAYQITTGTACHLDAHMVHHALHELPINDADVVFIENVGNLVCPASYDLGAHINVVLLSVPEGADKIQKYPVMFKAADIIVFTKCDLLPYFDFDMEEAKEDARRLNPKADILEISTKDEASVKKWISYLKLKKELRG